MKNAIVDPEGEVLPVPADPSTESHLRPDGSTAGVPDRTPNSVQVHAEEFVIEWMKGAVQKAKRAIVADAMRQNSSEVDIVELDKTIIDIISRWDFSRDPEYK